MTADTKFNQDFQEAEAMLAQKSQAAQPPGVQQLLESLQSAAVYTDTPNHETNRKLWDAYAKNWSTDSDWVQRMAGHLPGDAPRELECLGDEWSDEASFTAVMEEWVLPHASPAVRAAEIGSGGGRVAARVAGNVAELVCFDVSSEMLRTARRHLTTRGHSNVRFQHVAGEGDYPEEYHGTFDFVYSFDVFVHMDLHQMRRTLLCAHALLRPGGILFVTFANLLAPDGWQRFARQRHYSVGGFYFISPDIANCLLQQTGFEPTRFSEAKAGNTYLNRDLLVLARKPL